MERISLSIAPAVQVIGKPYYDLTGSIELMHRLWPAGVVDGFEFQNLAEWDASGPRSRRECPNLLGPLHAF